jgi:hypothetical protein
LAHPVDAVGDLSPPAVVDSGVGDDAVCDACSAAGAMILRVGFLLQ